MPIRHIPICESLSIGLSRLALALSSRHLSRCSSRLMLQARREYDFDGVLQASLALRQIRAFLCLVVCTFSPFWLYCDHLPRYRPRPPPRPLPPRPPLPRSNPPRPLPRPNPCISGSGLVPAACRCCKASALIWSGFGI